MAKLPRSLVAKDQYTRMRSLDWSHAERVIARKAFDLALRRELDEVILEAKTRAARIEQPSELWDLELYLSQRRKDIDQRYDYRYSVLPVVFGYLIRDGRLSKEELQGLSEDKLAYIARHAKI
jgi:hypothetical protein